MTPLFYRALVVLVGYPKTVDEHREQVATNAQTRSIAQNVSMVGFLGWLVILHYGPNSAVYPFFKFVDNPDPSDPYTFSLTFWASSVIWVRCHLLRLMARQLADPPLDHSLPGV